MREQITERWKRVPDLIRQHRRFFGAAVMALVPFLCCVIACTLQGRTIGQVTIAAGEWNDELFYFKQVEGIIHYGYPQGYFGFNESHALKASFAAWSPVLVLPWIIWGLLFGWSMSAPIYCNIFLMMLACFLFVWLTNPGWKKIGVLAALFAAFTPFTRYMLSCMPECICFAMVIIVLGLCVSYQEKEHPDKLAALFAMTAVMTLMRPYLLLFMLLPAYYLIRRKKVLGALVTLGIMGVTGAVYVLVNHYFGAEYFTPLFDTTWITTFLNSGIWQGIKYMGWRLLHMGVEFCELMWQGLKTNLFWGEYFVAFMAVFAVLIVQTVCNLRRKENKQFAVNLYLCVGFLGMLAALLLMYKMKEGSKHLLTFIAAGLFGISLMETKYLRKTIGLVAVFLVLFGISGVDPYEHKVPFTSAELKEREAYWQDVFAQECELDLENTPHFDNVMIWVFSDRVEDETVLTPYQMLYQLPKGFGISCCYADYVESNLEQLKSKYLATVSEGLIDALCVEKGFREVARDEGMVVYELHGEN